MALPSARATRASHQAPSGLGHPAGIANAQRERLIRKSALLTRRHSQMAAIDAPAIDRLGWMKMYRDACEVVFKRLREIETVR